jgi:hypothetical protein
MDFSVAATLAQLPLLTTLHQVAELFFAHLRPLETTEHAFLASGSALRPEWHVSRWSVRFQT